MANIDIKYTQAVIDQEHASSVNDAATPNGSIGTLLDALLTAEYGVNQVYQFFSSYSWIGTTLTLNYSDGATKTYTGVVRANASATKGTATATGFEFFKDGLLTIAETGVVNLNYELGAAGANSLSLSPGSAASQASALKFTTLVPSYNSAYDPVVGNVSVLIDGALSTQPSGAISGTLSKITMGGDKYILSGVIEGKFDVAGNASTVGQGLSNTAVTGTLTSYKDDYRDGSHTYITGVSTFLKAGQVIDETMLADDTRFSGDDVITIDLPGKLYADFLMASGGGNDVVTLAGGGARLNLNAGTGNDRISVLSDAHRIDGGAGLDTVALTSARAGYTVQKTSEGFTVKDSAGVTNTVLNVERLTFTDTSYALDIDGNGGQAYRIYQAAFDRTPDAGGLAYWIKQMDAGSTLNQVAANFAVSAEFTKMYGPTPSHADLVNTLYQHVLHRAGEAAGVAYWLGVLDNPAATTAGVLAYFSESHENQDALVGVIGNGFAYTPYVG